MDRRPWNVVPIAARDEPLLALPAQLLRIEPHPYVSLGAPYGSWGSPFRLRQEVVERLLLAQEALQRYQPGWRLAVFDAWRPLEVQAFMVRHAITERCRELGVSPQDTGSDAYTRIEQEVGQFWAPPNPDPLAPPPHSTGAAVDLTLVSAGGVPVAMGSAIDTIGPVSSPDHFLTLATAATDADFGKREQARRWHHHRTLLRLAMESAGFAQHPGEWWHFSWGDQLWAWRQGWPVAHYGRVDTGG